MNITSLKYMQLLPTVFCGFVVMIAMLANSVNAQAITFKPGSIPVFSMNSTTFNGFGGVLGFGAQKGFKDLYPQVVSGAQTLATQKKLIFNTNDSSVPLKEVSFKYIDADGVSHQVFGSEGNNADLLKVQKAYNDFLKNNNNPSAPPQQHESLVVGTKYEWLNFQLGWYCADKGYILKSGYQTPPGKALSDAKQCELAANERKGRPSAVKLGDAMVGEGVYTLGECKVNAAPGTPAQVKWTDASDENSFEACADDTKPGDGPAPGFPGLGDSPGSGNPGAGPGGGGLGGLLGGGGAGGLGGLLGPLLQGLMGGGQGGQQGYGQQGQYGAGYGNQKDCSLQPIAPACGTDGNTYKNNCWAQALGVPVSSSGICAPVVPSPIPTINSIVTLTQLSQSGIPATLLENVRNLVSSVLSGILAGASVQETKVK